jgi:ABC-type uncharacterized transport system auxiliary subunit
MNEIVRVLALAPVLAFAGCSSVDIPEERFYAIALHEAELGEPLVEVLRVADLQAVGAFGQDRIIVTDGVRYAPRALERWVVPADRMVTDALIVGLSRHGVARLVVASGDAGIEDWRLHGRLLEFAEVLREGNNAIRVRAELWLVLGDVLLLRREFVAEEAVEGEGVEAVVVAFSKGVDRITAELVAALRAVDLPSPGGAAVGGS